jgi:hypothetical protein
MSMGGGSDEYSYWRNLYNGGIIALNGSGSMSEEIIII